MANGNGLLYKYRSLVNYKNYVDIILNNRLWASNYKDMNDPMEGHYYYNRGELDEAIVKKLTEDKNSKNICSLSKDKNNILMWSHYADGHKGVVIGVQIDSNMYDIRPVTYGELPEIKNDIYNDQTAIEILSRKYVVWEYEKEERVFVNTGTKYVEVKVAEVITGSKMNKDERDFIKELTIKINPDINIQHAL